MKQKIRKKFNNFFQGFYDPVKDKIYGKKNTITYYHEEGHRIWFKKGIEVSLQTYSWLVACLAIFYYGYTLFRINPLLTIIFSTPIICLIISELHAWHFAIKKYRKKHGPKDKIQS